MQIYLDSANPEEIEEALSWGVISGVTTNPSLMAKETGRSASLVQRICRIIGGKKPVSVEVLNTVAEDMVKEARRITLLAANIVIKIPMGIEGLKTVYQLSQGVERVKCNVTLIFSVNQAILAARAGAAYVSPFIGRLDDIGWNGAGLVREMADVFKKHNINTAIIAASIRHPRHIHEAAMAGAHIATVPFSVLKQMVSHPLTDLGVERFLRDWAQNRTDEMF